MPIYMMPFYQLSVGVRKRFDLFRFRIVWDEDVNKRKYHLVKWDVVCMPKDHGGLGIKI